MTECSANAASFKDMHVRSKEKMIRKNKSIKPIMNKIRKSPNMREELKMEKAKNCREKNSLICDSLFNDKATKTQTT
jgi:hypothetical protein